MLTFMVYLTDGDDFEGGDTLFYAAGPKLERASQISSLAFGPAPAV